MPRPEGTPDPRVRSFVLPTRVVWASTEGVQNAHHLLIDDDAVCVMRPGRLEGEPPAVLLDFGRELHGGVRPEVPATTTGQPARVRVRFGESCSEAMGTPSQDHAIHDFDTLVPWMGHVEIGCTGFRFVRIDLLDRQAEIQLKQARAVFLYRPLEYVGAFECSDPRVSAIWETGAYTVHLCMQDHLWDGIKRDRLVWIGDMHPETMVVSTVFGESPVVPSSLDHVRDHTPLPGWMNGISSYSLWWILCYHDWYRYHGNRAYLAEQLPYLTALLAHLRAHLGPDGREALTGTRFLEWPTSRDPVAVDAGLQALVAMALRAGAALCRALGADAEAASADEAARRAAACRRAPTPSKQASALLALAGMADPAHVNRGVLAADPHHGLSTFYGYYVLQARALAGDHAGCLDLLRAYWGEMIDLGATTFWEDFQLEWTVNAAGIDSLVPPGKRDIHADFGDYCYRGLRHSLCHGWAAGPTAWLSEHVLGIAPASPGFETVRIRPRLAGLEWARGAVPTPHGPIRVEHRADGAGVRSEIELPAGVGRVE